MLVISVEATDAGWSMTTPGGATHLVFASGAAAERAARALGLQTAANGRPAEILVRLRSGHLAGRILCRP